MTDPYVSGDDVAIDDETAARYRKDRAEDDKPDHFPGYPHLQRFAYSDRYGKSELLSISKTRDGHLIGWVRIHIGEPEEHEHSIFLG